MSSDVSFAAPLAAGGARGMLARWWARRAVRADAWIRLGLVVAAFAPFAHTLLFGFIYDDTTILLHNPVIVGWHALFEVWKHPYWAQGGTATSGLYRPLLMFFLALVWNAARGFAMALHLYAVSVHVAATLLVAALLRRGVGRWPAAAGALWFAVHPVHVEAVANVANSSEALVCVWTLLLALWLVPSRDAAREPMAEVSWRRAAVAALLYAAALLTKESGGVAPALAFIAALAWAAPQGISPRDPFRLMRAWRRPIALWIAVLAGVVVLRRVVLGAVAGTGSMAVPGLAELDAPHRVEAMLSTGGHVVQLLLWPTRQTPDYGPSYLSAGLMQALAASLTALAIVALVLWGARRALRDEASSDPDARPLAAIAWCLIAYVPASNILGATGPILAERTLYLASVGVAMLVAWLVERSARRAAWPVIAGVLAVVAIRGYVRTSAYSRVWGDHHALFSRIVQVDSLDYRGYQLLAIYAKNQGQPEESEQLYARAFALRPRDPALLDDYATYLLEEGRPRHALLIAQRLHRDPRARTHPQALALLLTATDRVWGPDSARALAARLGAAHPR